MKFFKTKPKWCGIQETERRSSGRLVEERAFFRRKFIASKGQSYPIRITASDRYRLYVNTIPVHSGPARGDRFRQFIDTIDLLPYLSDGDNVICIVVTSFIPPDALNKLLEGPVAVHSRAGGPLLLVDHDEIGTHLTGWVCHGDKSVQWDRSDRSYTAPTEIWNGELYPFGWMEIQYDDSSWASTHPLWVGYSNPFGELPPFVLYDRPIPLLYMIPHSFVRSMPIRSDDASPIDLPLPSVILPNTKAVLELDAGELINGHFRLSVLGGKGATITCTYAECYILPGERKGNRSDWENGRIQGKYDVLLPSGVRLDFDHQEMHAIRFVRIFVETADEQLTLLSTDILSSGYPLVATAKISSEESWMSPLWDISLRTLERCMHETYMDCPYYEQLQYTQDSRLQMLFTYYAAADARMARRTLEDYHTSLMPEGILQSRYPSQITQIIPVFSLHWIFMLEDYYWQTGDTEPIMLYRPTMDAVLSWFERKLTNQGLVGKLPYWPFFDWVENWTFGDPPAALEGDGTATVNSLLYIMALDAAARLMNRTERPSLGVEYGKRAKKLRQQVNALCWSESDHIYLDAPDRSELSQHVQIFSVLAGVAKGRRARSIMIRALEDSRLAQCSFTMQFYLFRALEMVGLYERTNKLWDMWKVLLEQDLTTIPEVPGQSRSDCHAWGSLALYEFPAKFLGVQPMEPGWQHILIEPKALWLNKCSGIVPTPVGNVHIGWEHTQDGILIEGDTPVGIPVTVPLPNGTSHISQGGSLSITIGFICNQF